MTQPDLNFDRPRSRTTDPESSRRAESEMHKSGAMKSQRMIALQMIEQNQGKSSKDLGAIGPLDRYQIARRLKELAELKLIRGERNGTGDITWWPIPT